MQLKPNNSHEHANCREKWATRRPRSLSSATGKGFGLNLRCSSLSSSSWGRRKKSGGRVDPNSHGPHLMEHRLRNLIHFPVNELKLKNWAKLAPLRRSGRSEKAERFHFLFYKFLYFIRLRHEPEGTKWIRVNIAFKWFNFDGIKQSESDWMITDRTKRVQQTMTHLHTSAGRWSGHGEISAQRKR